MPRKNANARPKIRIVLLLLIFIVISLILYTGRRLVTQSEAQTCGDPDISRHQFSMVTLLSKNCAAHNSSSPKGVCVEGKACNTP